MHTTNGMSRRRFLGGAVSAALGTAVLRMTHAQAQAPSSAVRPCAVAVERGDSRAGNILQALKRIEPQVREAVAQRKRVVIKPNMVAVDNALASTHSECLEGILEFLSPFVKEEILIAESPASGSAAEGYANLDYLRLEKAYRVRFADLDAEPFSIHHMVNERHRPVPVRISSVLADDEAYVISAAVMKTHDRAVVTLGLKNVAVGAILKDSGFRWGPNSQGKSDKPAVHGGKDNEGIHFNMLRLAETLSPDLTVLDGFVGMEHNGPTGGTPVDHRVAVASTDWLAADRIGADLMGFDYNKIGYLVFGEQARMGETDLSRIEILGPALDECRRTYLPHDSIERQYGWMS